MKKIKIVKIYLRVNKNKKKDIIIIIKNSNKMKSII
jgi:hypothetical protein